MLQQNPPTTPTRRRPAFTFRRAAALIAGGLLGVQALGFGTAHGAPSNTITARQHEGQRPDGTYTPGNIAGYDEGDSINFRFVLDGAAGTSGELVVRFTGDDSDCFFFEQEFTLGTHDGSAIAVEQISGTPPTVSTDGSPVADGDEFVQTLDITFTDAGVARVNYFLTLSDDASGCNGSSQHSRLDLGMGDEPGDIQNPGAQNVPVAAPGEGISQTTLEVVKLLDPTDDPGLFDLLIDGTIEANDVGHLGTTGTEPVTAGEHTISETAADGNAVAGYTTTVACLAGAELVDVTAGDDPNEFILDVAEDTSVTCFFTNTALQAPATTTLEVIKVLDPTDDPGRFDLLIDDVVRAEDAGHLDTTGAVTVNPNADHTVGEEAGTGTDLADYTTAITCFDGVLPLDITDGAVPTEATVPVDEGSTVRCFITNQRQPGEEPEEPEYDNDSDGDDDYEDDDDYGDDDDGPGDNARGNSPGPGAEVAGDNPLGNSPGPGAEVAGENLAQDPDPGVSGAGARQDPAAGAPQPAPEVAAEQIGASELPRTGSGVGGVTVFALVLIGLGTAATLAGRRRATVTSPSP